MLNFFDFQENHMAKSLRIFSSYMTVDDLTRNYCIDIFQYWKLTYMVRQTVTEIHQSWNSDFALQNSLEVLIVNLAKAVRIQFLFVSTAHNYFYIYKIE